jgi:hypothetical protein
VIVTLCHFPTHAAVAYIRGEYIMGPQEWNCWDGRLFWSGLKPCGWRSILSILGRDLGSGHEGGGGGRVSTGNVSCAGGW